MNASMYDCTQGYTFIIKIQEKKRTIIIDCFFLIIGPTYTIIQYTALFTSGLLS